MELPRVCVTTKIALSTAIWWGAMTKVVVVLGSPLLLLPPPLLPPPPLLLSMIIIKDEEEGEECGLGSEALQSDPKRQSRGTVSPASPAEIVKEE
jgi:hypothetical protein